MNQAVVPVNEIFHRVHVIIGIERFSNPVRKGNLLELQEACLVQAGEVQNVDTDYVGWLNDGSLHYRLRLLDVRAPRSEFKEDALQLEHRIYSSRIPILKNDIVSARITRPTFMEEPLEPLAHFKPRSTVLKVGRLCKDSGSATAYTVPSRHYAAGTECSHINCQVRHTIPP